MKPVGLLVSLAHVSFFLHRQNVKFPKFIYLFKKISKIIENLTQLMKDNSILGIITQSLN